MKELDVALEAVNKTKKLLMNKKFKVYSKADKSPVTDIDRKVEKIIVTEIKKNFPEHDFLGEEYDYKKSNSEYKWIIDPIDGTKQFVRGIPFFGTSIGLEINGKIVLGVISIPQMNMLGYAVKGRGTVINGQRARVSKIHRIEDASFSFGYIDKIEKLGCLKGFMSMIRKCAWGRGYGDVLGYLMVANGSIDIFLDTNSPWDIAAAKIIVEEAGGKMTDLNGNDTIYSGNSVTTNGKLHNKALEILKQK